MLKSYGIPVRLDDNFVDIRRDLDQIIPVLIASIIFISSLIVVFFLLDNIEPTLGYTLTLAAHRVRSSTAVNFSYLEEGNEFHIYQNVIDRWSGLTLHMNGIRALVPRASHVARNSTWRTQTQARAANLKYSSYSKPICIQPSVKAMSDLIV